MAPPAFTLPGPEYRQVAWVHNAHMVGSLAPLEQPRRWLRPRILADGLPD